MNEIPKLKRGSTNEKVLTEYDIYVFNYVLQQQKETEHPVTSKEICKVLNTSDRDLRRAINALRHFYRGVAGMYRIVKHFIGETGEGFQIGTTIKEDNWLRETTANIALKKANNLEAKGINIKENSAWGVYQDGTNS